MAFEPPILLRQDYASKLCYYILEYWVMILREESWALKTNPEPLRNPASSTSDSDNSEIKDGSEIYGVEVMDIDSMNEQEYEDTKMDDGDIADLDLRRWRMTRFLLKGERDRLCLWKFEISDKDLDQLVTKRESLGISVLGSLLRIGFTVLDNTEIATSDNPADSRGKFRQEFQQFLEEGSNYPKHLFLDDDGTESSFREYSTINQSTVTDQPEVETAQQKKSLFEALKDDIDELQRLSFPIYQALAHMNPETALHSSHANCYNRFAGSVQMQRFGLAV